MKTRHWIRLALFCIFPAFISLAMVAAIAFEWLLTNQSKLAGFFLTGEFNRMFTFILFGSGSISCAIIFTVMIMLSQHADDIDRLQEAKMLLYRAKERYDAATQKFADQTKIN